MHDLPGTQEFDGLPHVGVGNQAQNIVVGGTCFLFCSQILVKVGDGVALGGDGHSIKGNTGGGLGIDPKTVVHEVGIQSGGLDLLLAQVAGELVNNATHHFQVGQLLGTHVVQDSNRLGAGHGKPLGQVTKGCTQLPIGAAVLGNDDLSRPCIGTFDLYREFKGFDIAPHGLHLHLPGPGGRDPGPAVLAYPIAQGQGAAVFGISGFGLLKFAAGVFHVREGFLVGGVGVQEKGCLGDLEKSNPDPIQ